MNNNLGNLFEFMWILQKLKENKRWMNTETFVKKESVADHVWRALIVHYIVYKNIEIKVDFLKVMKLVLVHDLVEAIAWDTDYTLVYLWIVSKDEKHNKEFNAIKEIRNTVWWKIWNEIFDLWMEYEKWETKEAKFVKALEKIESTDHAIYYWYTYINIPHKFATYCNKTIAKVPELKWLYHQYKIKLKNIFIQWDFEWKKDYNIQWDFEEFKNFESIFKFFQIAQKLKETKWYKSLQKNDIKETVAQHSFRLTFLVWLVVDILDLKINLEKALKIAMFHDIVKSITWDFDYKLIYTWKISNEEKRNKKILAIEKIRKILPKEIGKEVYELFYEYEGYETREAKLVKSLDKIEWIDHIIRHWLDNIDDPDRYINYLNSSIKFCDEIKPVFELYKERLKEMYENWWFVWKEEYDVVF